MASIRIGVSGWRYAPWRGVFYPKDLPQKDELAYAASRFPTVELNGSFYSLQTPASYRRWYEQTPAGFVFGVKGSRYITHMLRLLSVETPLANFFASGLFELREKLGPILWQLPRNFRYDPERLEAFFQMLPRDTEAALALARKRDARVKGRARLSIDAVRPLRHALEVRHPSYRDESFVALLRKHAIALVVSESAHRWPMFHDVTADFLYLRLHGDTELYTSAYELPALERWAARVRAWHRGREPADAEKISPSRPPARRARDVFCYFDNTDVKLRAPFDAATLIRLLGLETAQAGAPTARRRA